MSGFTPQLRRVSLDRRALALTAGKGFMMGSADVVPGVSGGTMAFILGIYPRLLAAIRAFDIAALRLLLRGRLREFAEHVDLVFLVALGAGIVAALLFFTRVVPLPRLIITSPEPVYSLFFGLIAASIIVLLRDLGGLRAPDTGWLLAGTVLGFAVVNLVPVQTPESAWFVFLSGALAITAMILPGISGSFILVVLGKYAYVFGAVGRLDIIVLAPFLLGIVCGLMLFSRVLMWLLEHHYRRSILTIMGVLVGSLWVIWPFQHRVTAVIGGKTTIISRTPIAPEGPLSVLLLCALLAIAGVAGVLVVHALAQAAERRQAANLESR